MHRKIEEEPILIGHLVRSSETVLENEPEFLSISENLRHKEIIREKKEAIAFKIAQHAWKSCHYSNFGTIYVDSIQLKFQPRCRNMIPKGCFN